jgi:transcriptional regulator with XRE-family HTH domain
MKNYELLGENIQIIRKLRGMTQQELSKKVGINLQNLSKIERGVNYPTFETLDKIIAILGVTPNELLLGDWKNTSHMEEAIMRVLRREEDFNVELEHLKCSDYYSENVEQVEQALRLQELEQKELQKLRDYLLNYISSENRVSHDLYELKKWVQFQKLQKVLNQYDEMRSVDRYGETLNGERNVNPYDEYILDYLTAADEKHHYE